MQAQVQHLIDLSRFRYNREGDQNKDTDMCDSRLN